MRVQWIALAIGCALMVALFGGTIVMFQSQEMWGMTSSNAQTWNATLNGSATCFNVIPLFVLVIVVMVILGFVSTRIGFMGGV